MLHQLLLHKHQHHAREEEELLLAALLKIAILVANGRFDVIEDDPTVSIEYIP